ncbi:MAG: hypothetical protein ACPHID_06695 [Thermoplasmatota archaeon]
MGFATVATAAILTVAALVGGTTYVNADQDRNAQLRQAQGDAEARQLALKQTDLGLISATHSIPLRAVVVVVTNTGDSTIDASGLDVLVDGVVVTDQISSTLINAVDTDVWAPLGTATIIVEGYNPGSNPDRVAVVTAGGHMVFGSVV